MKGERTGRNVDWDKVAAAVPNWERSNADFLVGLLLLDGLDGRAERYEVLTGEVEVDVDPPEVRRPCF